jgi:hypothetical protein
MMKTPAKRSALLCLACLVAMSAVAAAGAKHYYVATGGSDAWSGGLAAATPAGKDGPFATVSRARDAIREHRGSHAERYAYVVNIRGGVYHLAERIKFTPEDSGTRECPVTYQAFGEEKPILSGGHPISGWTRGTGKTRHLWLARVPAVAAGGSPPNQLFVNGVRRPRARTCLRGAGRSRSLPLPRQSLRFNDGDFTRWDNLDDVLIRAYSSWIVSLHWIKELDLPNQIVTFTNRGWEFGRFDGHQRYIIENFLPALDTPGEWFLNREGTLHYWPRDGEKLTSVSATMPVVRERLFEFAGDFRQDRYVEYMTFKGLSFRHVDWSIRKDSWYDHQDYAALNWAAIYATGLRHSRFEDCEIGNIGVHGIYLAAGCQNNAIVRCHVHDTGGGGIYVGSRKSSTEGKTAAVENTVDNNFVHDVGRIFGGSVGIYLGRGARNTVSHNEVCDTDWSGLSLGNPGDPPSAGHTVESNHIHHVLRGMLSDGAGIYTLGTSSGTAIRNNLIHDAYAYPTSPGRGIYHDTMSAGYTCENNVVYNVSGHGILQCGQAVGITVRNNILAFCDLGGVCRASLGSAMEKNIVYLPNNRSMITRVAADAAGDVDRNLYWAGPGAANDARFSRQSFAEWQTAGGDRHSVIADPLFVDPGQHDFSLRPESPALKLGFQPIDASTVGLYGETEWTSLPKRVRGTAASLPVFPPRPALSLDDGFEDGEIGSLPGCLAMISELKGRIRISDEAAATGRKSLKFTDAPGMKSFYPYMYDQSFKIDSGTVTFSFDVMQSSEAPGRARIHFRDYQTPGTNPAAGGPNASSYVEGPDLMLTSKGQLIANQKDVMQVPAGKWVHVTARFTLGPGKPKLYTITARLLGEGTAKTVADVPFTSPHFAVFTGLFVLAELDPAGSHPVFYLDNLRLDHSPPLAKPVRNTQRRQAPGDH